MDALRRRLGRIAKLTIAWGMVYWRHQRAQWEYVAGSRYWIWLGECFESFWFWAIWAIDWRALRKLDNYVLRGEREHFTPCLRASLFVWKRKFFLRFQKNSRPLVEFSHSLRLFTCIPWIDLKTITYPTAHAWRLRVGHHEPAK